MATTRRPLVGRDDDDQRHLKRQLRAAASNLLDIRYWKSLRVPNEMGLDPPNSLRGGQCFGRFWSQIDPSRKKKSKIWRTHSCLGGSFLAGFHTYSLPDRQGLRLDWEKLRIVLEFAQLGVDPESRLDIVTNLVGTRRSHASQRFDLLQFGSELC